MGVDHGGGYILVAKQFLHRADIIAILQQMGSKNYDEMYGRSRALPYPMHEPLS